MVKVCAVWFSFFVLQQLNPKFLGLVFVLIEEEMWKMRDVLSIIESNLCKKNKLFCAINLLKPDPFFR